MKKSVFARLLFAIVLCPGMGLPGVTQTPKQRVIMISLDACSDSVVDALLKKGVLPANGAFGTMKKHGAFAEAMVPITIGSTAPAHIAMFTGAIPAENGIVGNNMFLQSYPWESRKQNGFKAPILAETIWQAARRQGKKVMAIGGPGLDILDESRKVDYLFAYPKDVAQSLIIEVEAQKAATNNNTLIRLQPTANSAYQTVYKCYDGTSFPFSLYLRKKFIAGKPSQEVVFTANENTKEPFETTIKGNNWNSFAVTFNGKQYHINTKILQSDALTGKYTLYMGMPYLIEGTPDSFVQHIVNTTGIWPGEIDNPKLVEGTIGWDIWFDQLNRMTLQTTKAIQSAMKAQDDWDILFSYYATLDDIQHAFMMQDERQMDYHAENGNRKKRYDKYYEDWYRKMDDQLKQIMQAAPLGTNFVVVSDHGMIPTHTSFVVSHFLEQKGFGNINQDFAVTSNGTSGFIYLNENKITGSARENMIQQMAAALKALKDPTTGEQVIEVVATEEKQKEIGLYHAGRSGEIFISMRPGFSLSPRYAKNVGYLLRTAYDMNYHKNEDAATIQFLKTGGANELGLGAHGSMNYFKRIEAVFYATGPSIPKKDLGRISSLQVAPTIAHLLNISKPKQANRDPLF